MVSGIRSINCLVGRKRLGHHLKSTLTATETSRWKRLHCRQTTSSHKSLFLQLQLYRSSSLGHVGHFFSNQFAASLQRGHLQLWLHSAQGFCTDICDQTRAESKVWYYCSQHVICMQYFQATTLCCRQYGNEQWNASCAQPSWVFHSRADPNVAHILPGMVRSNVLCKRTISCSAGKFSLVSLAPVSAGGNLCQSVPGFS